MTRSDNLATRESRTITRADLAEAVYQKVGLSRAESAELVETVLREVSDTIARGENVKLSSFGSFIVRAKGERDRAQSEDRSRSADHPAACHGVQAVECPQDPHQWGQP